MRNLAIVLTVLLGCIAPAIGAEIFSQTFSDGGVAADYETGGSASGSLFYDFHANSPASIGINAGQAILDLPTSGGDAGFSICGVGDGGVMAFSMDLYLGWDGVGDHGPSGQLAFGDYTGDFTTYAHNNSTFAKIGFRRAGTMVRIEPQNGSTYDIDLETDYVLQVFLNDSGSEQSYEGPDGSTYTLSTATLVDGSGDAYIQGSYAVWIGTTLIGDNLAAGSYVHTGEYTFGKTLDSILLDINSDAETARTWTIDNVTVNDALPIPEPTTLALIAVGGLAMLKRRQ